MLVMVLTRTRAMHEAPNINPGIIVSEDEEYVTRIETLD